MPSGCDDFVDSHEPREDELVTDLSVVGRFGIAGLDTAEPFAELLDAVANECPSHEYLLSMDDLLPEWRALIPQFRRA